MNNPTKTNTVAGTYKIKVHTPMGIENGTLKLTVDENSLSGSLENSRGSTEFTGGIVDGNQVNFDTKIKTPVGRVKAKVTGEIKDDAISLTAKLPLGTAQIEGNKIK